MNAFNLFMPTRILFGPGRLSELGSTPHLPGGKALVVTGASGAMERAGILGRVVRALEGRGMEAVVYAGVTPNPVESSIDEAARLARERSCDVVIGLGGGSPMDAAKAVAVAATNPGRFWEYVQRGTGGRRQPEKPPLPIVTITTTSGTGSECDPWAVISRLESKEKLGFGFESTIPALAIVDPELTIGLPPAQTAHTGMDAFFHAAETFLATVSQPASELFSLESVRLISRHLPTAIRDGSNLEARAGMAWAATAAGVCQTLSANIVHHPMEHALSAMNPSLPHGLGLVMLSRAFFGILESRKPEAFLALAGALGADDGKPMPFARALEDLIARCGLDGERLSGHGFSPSDVRALTDNVYATVGRHFDITPVALSREDVADVFTKSM
ncbi:1,3-propanediol dehydrogenase [Fundidesulfovibrio magnetotacticus]|uniref:1,3-propanediol dehydrogenase n=1 Tax=Fundidesulfovibrio magnetotacticus TaxID=2730080 RepID=A0A6V8M1M4_9BACT|nr:iron-containing alcohol dehydrogenase [Fundidesulfovibrio magnetotacticus]GFK95846.1 1,3-propanediol dehydrogenase [Fundidesulfovibrio magnetotacticus]